jgi:hypothetical protein
MSSMRRRPWLILATLSLGVCQTTLALWIYSFQLKPSPGGASGLLPDSFPVTMDFRIVAYDGNLSFHNLDAPYTGSIIGFGNDPTLTGALDLPGVYYRHFTSPRMFPHCSYWTLTIPLSHVAIVTALPPLAWIIANFHRRRPPRAAATMGFEPIVN